jgi:hypothetical protein
MPAGRRPMGIEQVELLSGSEAAKRRLQVFLANLAGALSVADACAALNLHESRFFELRKLWLQESVETLEPEPPGRPVGAGQGALVTGANRSADPEIGSDGEKRHPRIASNASGDTGPTPDTSGNGVHGTLGRIGELEDLLAQTRWELRTSRLREELAELGLSRPKRVRPAQKKTRLPGGGPGGGPTGERGGAR